MAQPLAPQRLLFVAAISPAVFRPECLAEGGRDLFRVVLEFLRTIRRHGVLLNLDGGSQFDGEFVARMNEQWWTPRALRRGAEAVEAELAAIGTAPADAPRRRRLLRQRDRWQTMPPEYGTLYTQGLEILANEGRIITAPRTGQQVAALDGPEMVRALADLEPAALRPDLVLFPPGHHTPPGGVSLMELAQGDLLMRLGVGDAVALKTTSGYREALGRVVMTARQRVALVDPYLATLAEGTGSRYYDFLALLFELMATRPASLPPLEVTLHTGEMGAEFNAGRRTRTLQQNARNPGGRARYVEEQHRRLGEAIRHCYRETQSAHPALLHRTGRFRVVLWLERFDFRRTDSGRVVETRLIGERLHDRYMLTDHVGVELPYGLDCQNDDSPPTPRPANSTIVKLLSREAKEWVEARFGHGHPGRKSELAYESLLGPHEINLPRHVRDPRKAREEASERA